MILLACRPLDWHELLVRCVAIRNIMRRDVVCSGSEQQPTRSLKTRCMCGIHLLALVVVRHPCEKNEENRVNVTKTVWHSLRLRYTYDAME